MGKGYLVSKLTSEDISAAQHIDVFSSTPTLLFSSHSAGNVSTFLVSSYILHLFKATSPSPSTVAQTYEIYGP